MPKLIAESWSLDAMLERLTVFVIAATLAGLALALSGLFVASVVLVLAILATVLYHDSGRQQVLAVDAPAALRGRHVLAVLLVALLFRLMPYPYVLGGQDQGVYTNVAAQLVRTHSLAVSDPVFDKVVATGEWAPYVADNYTDPFLPGVYTLPGPQRPRLEFQFYHVFPVWLALSGGVFGLDAAVYGLTFLSLLSVLFFQRLATLLSGSGNVGVAAGLLLAVNPLHAFFSKFPLTEVPTLAFSLIGLTYLAMYARAVAERRQPRWLVLSALAFGCLFLTRISGFMYLPFFIAASVTALAFDRDRDRARAITAWALATVALYLASVAYGLLMSHSYSIKIYQQSFGMLAGEQWRAAVLALSVLLFGVWAAAAWAVRSESSASRLRAVLARGERLMGVAVLLVLALGAYKAYRLGFSGDYAAVASYTQFPGVVGAGWSSIAHTSVYVLAIYLCPLMLAAYIALAQLRWTQPEARYLSFFLLGFLAYAVLLNWVIAYQPYYARYLASELVPYIILFTTCCYSWLHSPRWRSVLGVALVVSGVYGTVLTVAQLGKVENAGAFDSISRLARLADSGDLILLHGLEAQGVAPKELKTTLALTFGRQVASIGDASLKDLAYVSALGDAYDDVFLATGTTTAPAGFVRVDAIRVQADSFGHSAHPPWSIGKYLDANISVFRLDAGEFVAASHQRFRAGSDPRILTQVGVKDPTAQTLVSTGQAGYLMYGPYVPLPAGRYRVQLRGSATGAAGKSIRFEVAHGSGATLLAQAAPASVSLAGPVIATMDFTIPPEGVKDLEVRVLVPDGVHAAISDYTISRTR